MNIHLGDIVEFPVSRTSVRPYVHTLTGQVTHVNDINATVAVTDRLLYVVPLDALTKVDGATVVLMSGAGAIE